MCGYFERKRCESDVKKIMEIMAAATDRMIELESIVAAKDAEIVELKQERDALLKVREAADALAEVAEFASQLIGDQGLIDVILKNACREGVWDNPLDELQACEAEVVTKILYLVKAYKETRDEH